MLTQQPEAVDGVETSYGVVDERMSPGTAFDFSEEEPIDVHQCEAGAMLKEQLKQRWREIATGRKLERTLERILHLCARALLRELTMGQHSLDHVAPAPLEHDAQQPAGTTICPLCAHPPPDAPLPLLL